MMQLNEGDIEKLSSFRPPFIHTYYGDQGPLTNGLEKNSLTAITLEGGAMRDDGGILREFSEKLHFPEYFGDNYNALWDCLTDLAWLESTSYLIVVKDADQLFLTESVKEGLSILEYLRDASIDLAIPVAAGSYKRGSMSFNTILQTESEQQIQRIQMFLDERVGVRYWDVLNTVWNS